MSGPGLNYFLYFLYSQLKEQDEPEIYKENQVGIDGGVSEPADMWKIRPKMLKLSMASAVQHTDHSWKLQPDTAHNEHVRSEFYYEQVHCAIAHLLNLLLGLSYSCLLHLYCDHHHHHHYFTISL